MYKVIILDNIIFKSMTAALRASSMLKVHGIISKPVRTTETKCGCCVRLNIMKGSVSEAAAILKEYAFQFEMSE